MVGPEDIVALLRGLAWRKGGVMQGVLKPVRINGYPGVILIHEDGPTTIAFQPGEDGKLAGVYFMRNPEKLRHVPSAAQSEP
jgi:RNA polymerase sigma-70 factor (ECF subfamily)